MITMGWRNTRERKENRKKEISGKRGDDCNEGEREHSSPHCTYSAGPDVGRRRDGAAVTRTYHPSPTARRLCFPPVTERATHYHTTIHTARCFPTPCPAPFPGPWIDSTSVRTSVRKLAATAVTLVCIRDWPRRMYIGPTFGCMYSMYKNMCELY